MLQANTVLLQPGVILDGGVVSGLGIFGESGVPVDPDAAAYAAERGLTGDPFDRLNAFLLDVKAAGANLILTTMGRSEFLGRAGATHHAVIGPDATITGTLGNTTNGIVFDGDAGDVFQFDNPNPTTSAYMWLLVVVIPTTVSASTTLLSGSVNSTGPYGPRLAIGGSPNGRVGFWSGAASAGTTLRSRTMAYAGASVGTPLLAMGQFDGSFVQPIKDIMPETALAGAGPLWNNDATGKWRLGAQLSNHTRLTGTIALAMAGTGILIRERIWRLAAAIVRHNIAGITPPSWLGFVGDSMTVSASGGIDPAEGRSAKWVTKTSGWKGSFYDLEAIGGTSISGQETFFATMMTRMSWVPDMPRTIVFWGGYNAVGPFDFSSAANAQALADRYIAMAVTAAAAGIKTVHWSRTTEASVTDGSVSANNINVFNDYYKAQIALLGSDHIFYDHRITYPGPAQGGTAGTHFDGPNRNATYFGDDIHCSPTGIDTLMNDFLTQYPNP